MNRKRKNKHLEAYLKAIDNSQKAYTYEFTHEKAVTYHNYEISPGVKRIREDDFQRFTKVSELVKTWENNKWPEKLLNSRKTTVGKLKTPKNVEQCLQKVYEEMSEIVNKNLPWIPRF